MNNIYTCPTCSKSFNSAKSLSSHKKWHDPNYAIKGRLGVTNGLSKASAKRAQLQREETENKKKQYYLNPRFCVGCENILSYEKKGNKFCSHSCSALHQNERSKESIEKQKISLAKTLASRPPRLPKSLKSSKIKICEICKIEHTRKAKTCSKECYKKLQSNQAKGKNGGWRNFGGNGKKGTVHGIIFQSSWEEVWIRYHVQENIPFRRCTEYFEYEFEGKTKRYYPDFFLFEQNSYVEVKGFWSDKTEAKLKSIPKEYGIIVARKDEINAMRNALK